MVGSLTNDLHFRVLYRKKGMPKSEQWNFTAPDGEALLKMLARTEDVSPDTCDLLVVHCYLGTGETIEICCHEPKEVEGSNRSQIVVPMVNTSKQEEVISATFELLSRGREAAKRITAESKSETKPETKPEVLPQHRGVRLVTAFGVEAYPAISDEDQT